MSSDLDLYSDSLVDKANSQNNIDLDVGGFLLHQLFIFTTKLVPLACIERFFITIEHRCVRTVQRLVVMCCIIGTDPCCSAGLGSHSPTGSRSSIRQLYLSAALCWRYLRAAMLRVSQRPQLLISRLIRKV